MHPLVLATITEVVHISNSAFVEDRKVNFGD